MHKLDKDVKRKDIKVDVSQITYDGEDRISVLYSFSYEKSDGSKFNGFIGGTDNDVYKIPETRTWGFKFGFAILGAGDESNNIKYKFKNGTIISVPSESLTTQPKTKKPNSYQGLGVCYPPLPIAYNPNFCSVRTTVSANYCHKLFTFEYGFKAGNTRIGKYWKRKA